MFLFVRSLILVLVVAASGCVTKQPPPNQTEVEARTAFKKLVEVAGKGNVEQFKSMIVPADLAKMETIERDKPEFFPMLMGLIAQGGDPDTYKAEVIRPDRVTFQRLVVSKTPDLSSKETTTVTLLRQGNRWLLGKAGP
jgi:hypothetical protein